MKVGEINKEASRKIYFDNLCQQKQNKSHWIKETDTILLSKDIYSNSNKSSIPKDSESYTSKSRESSNISYYQNVKVANQYKNRWNKPTDTILQRGAEYVIYII